MDEKRLEDIRGELEHVAARKKTVTYNVLALRVGLRRVPTWYKFIAVYLDEINWRETSADRPMLTAVVVTEETGMPGEGFWKCAHGTCRVWDGKGSKEDFWRKELKRVWDYWGKR